MLSALIFASSRWPQPSPQASRTATPAPPSQPVKAKKILVKQLPSTLQGIALVNGVFKLQPGYKFEKRPNNRVALVRNDGGDLILTTSTARVRLVPGKRLLRG